MGAQSSSFVHPDSQLANQQNANIVALQNLPPEDPKRLAAIKEAVVRLEAIEARLTRVKKHISARFDDFSNLSNYLNTIFEDVKQACKINQQYMPFTIFFTLEPDRDKKQNVGKTLFSPFCSVILIRYLVYHQWIGTYETLMEVEKAFERVAKTMFAPNDSEFAVLQQIATLQQLQNNFTFPVDALKPYFVYTNEFPDINIERVFNGPEVTLHASASSEQTVYEYLNYLVQHWKRLESLDGFVDNPGKFFATLRNSQATAIQQESTLRDSISHTFVNQQTLRLSIADMLPTPLQPPLDGAPRVFVIIAATHGVYWVDRKNTKIKMRTAIVPYNMTLTKVPLVRPGLISYQAWATRREHLSLFNELKQQLNPTPPSLRDVLEQVEGTTQQYSTNVRDIHTERMQQRLTQYNPAIEAQLYSEKLYPMTYLPCKKYLNKTFGINPEDRANKEVEYKLATVNYNGEGSSDLMEFLGTKLADGRAYTNLDQIMEYAKQRRVQHVILIDLTCASFTTPDFDIGLMPSEIQQVATKWLEKFQLGGGKQNSAV